MIYPIERTDSWASKYSLTVQENICPKCSTKIVACKPFADGNLRGFISEDHGCGIENCLIVFKTLSEQDKAFLKDIFVDKYVEKD